MCLVLIQGLIVYKPLVNISYNLTVLQLMQKLINLVQVKFISSRDNTI